MPDSLSPDLLLPSLNTHTKPLVKDVDLVLVPVTVADSFNRLVPGLSKEDFQLYQDGQKQRILHFSSEDAPISLGVLFDTSGSMAHKMARARKAISDFFRVSNPEDEFFVITFSNSVRLLQGYTSDVERVERKLADVPASGRTALLDGVRTMIDYMRQARYSRKAVLIISDGGDNCSKAKEDDVRSLLEESDIQVYALGIYDEQARNTEERHGPDLLANITRASGGQTFVIDDPQQLMAMATAISLELRNQYILGYRPAPPSRDGKWHKIEVKLTVSKGAPRQHVYAKNGYFARSD